MIVTDIDGRYAVMSHEMDNRSNLAAIAVPSWHSKDEWFMVIYHNNDGHGVTESVGFYANRTECIKHFKSWAGVPETE